jgi:hypothetical protein
MSLPQAPVLDQSQAQNPYNPQPFQTTVSGGPQQLRAIGYAAFLRKLKSSSHCANNTKPFHHHRQNNA